MFAISVPLPPALRLSAYRGRIGSCGRTLKMTRMAPLRHADRRCECLFIAVDRKWSIRGQNDAIDLNLSWTPLSSKQRQRCATEAWKGFGVWIKILRPKRSRCEGSMCRTWPNSSGKGPIKLIDPHGVRRNSKLGIQTTSGVSASSDFCAATGGAGSDIAGAGIARAGQRETRSS
jgi:hypothetical protein